MGSDNPSGADNQQETELAMVDPWWVVGFVDGEGCFSVSIHRNQLATPTRGWQIQPSFHVSQHMDAAHSLRTLKVFFGCGAVRRKSQTNPVLVYSVHSTLQLVERVIPFFEEYPLRVKHDDFLKFATITRSVRNRSHHRPEVFSEIVKLAYEMNARGKQRKRLIGDILEGSSETTR